MALTILAQLILLCAVGAFFGRVAPGQRGLLAIAVFGPPIFLLAETLSAERYGVGMVARALCGSVGLGVSFAVGWRLAKGRQSRQTSGRV